MVFQRVTENKKDYLPLLLLADEQESMVDRYLDAGHLFVLREEGTTGMDGVVGEIVLFPLDGGVCEIKSLAVMPEHQKKGFGRALVEFAAETCPPPFHTLLVGTGESPATLGFYKKCGFCECGRIPNFFTENYDHEIIEDGVRLTDMILLQKSIR